MAGIYLHIPFCKQACSYCDFYFVTRKGMRSDFVHRLCLEIDFYRDTKYTGETIKTIYLGGGTPSQLHPSEIEQIFQFLHRTFDVDAEEITMEINPDDVSTDYLRDLHSIGINRASMGVQSFDPGLLAFMNRAHNPSEAEHALDILRETGFNIFTVDLIYGNPGQSLKSLEKDIENLLRFDPPHISAYSLTIEPKTRLGKQAELGRLEIPDDELVADHFDLLTEKLADAGIQRYEISNYSKPGFEAIHNTSYWKHENYLGLGPSAHSFWWADETTERWKVLPDIRRYLNKPFEQVHVEREPLTLFQLAEERLMLGLRTREGVTLAELDERYSYQLSRNQEQWLEVKSGENLLEYDNEKIRLTNPGLKIADHLVVELLTRH